MSVFISKNYFLQNLSNLEIMKKINLIVTILFVGLYSCKAQTNQLTEAEFYNIKINNITLRSIYDTNADLTKMRTLFGDSLVYQANTTGPSLGRDFWNDNIYLNFEDDSNTGNQYNLTNIQVESSSENVTIKGITIKLGDDVSIFGKNVVINRNNGDNSVVFISELSSSFAFKIDELTNKIIEITFNAY